MRVEHCDYCGKLGMKHFTDETGKRTCKECKNTRWKLIRFVEHYFDIAYIKNKCLYKLSAYFMKLAIKVNPCKIYIHVDFANDDDEFLHTEGKIYYQVEEEGNCRAYEELE